MRAGQVLAEAQHDVYKVSRDRENAEQHLSLLWWAQGRPEHCQQDRHRPSWGGGQLAGSLQCSCVLSDGHKVRAQGDSELCDPDSHRPAWSKECLACLDCSAVHIFLCLPAHACLCVCTQEREQVRQLAERSRARVRVAHLFLSCSHRLQFLGRKDHDASFHSCNQSPYTHIHINVHKRARTRTNAHPHTHALVAYFFSCLHKQIPMLGEGDQYPDLKPGNVIVGMRVADHKLFSRKGNDLMYGANITLFEALVSACLCAAAKRQSRCVFWTDGG